MKSIKKHLKILFIKRKIKQVSDRHINEINALVKNSNVTIEPEIIKAHKQKWSRIFNGRIDLKWLYWYSEISQIKSIDFVPENIYYTIIEKILNEQTFSLSYSDKNIYGLLYPGGLFPETILRNINGSFYSNYYKPLNISNNAHLLNIIFEHEMIITKPSLDSGGGKDVELFFRKNDKFINKSGRILTYDYLQTFYKHDYIIQKYLHQHPFLEQFNKTSLNTIRILTYRNVISNKINILHCLLRVGAKNQYLDNIRAGGFGIGINSKGVLNNYAINKSGLKTYIINDIDLSNTQFIIPFFDKIIELAKEIANKNIYHRLLGLDITIDNLNNIRCIEINNNGNGINLYQLMNGPLFGEFTDEIINYCERNIDKLYTKFDVYV